MISNSDNSVANGMIRPRILYVTTEKVVDAFDSSSCRINLPDSIYPEDGFTLVAGLRSFGFEASAWNISEEQGNNRLRLTLIYQPPAIIQPGIPNPDSVIPITIDKDILIPDGLYQSLDEMFEVLSGSVGSYYTIPTGYYKEPWVPIENQTDLNKTVLLPLKWKVESYGFSIAPQVVPDTVPRTATSSSGNVYPCTQVHPRLIKIILTPSPSSPLLYNLLFTNNVQDSSPSIPVSDRHKTGSINPPGGIEFTLSDFPVQSVAVDYRPYGSYTYNLIEYGNPYLDTANRLFQMDSLPYPSLPWKSFSTPRLSPLYLDISCQGLPTMNMTVDGLAANILHRQFLPGSNLGLEGIYQEFNTPIWYRLENRDQITQLIFDFKTESNKWRFYNMNFFLEIIFFEVEEEKAYMDTFNPPSNPDQLTGFVQQYSRNAGNPHGFADPTGRSGVVYFSQDRKRRK